jgi:hypothetical protein
MSMTRFEWLVIAAALGALVMTAGLIRFDSACSYHPNQSTFACDVAHGYVAIMAPTVR